MYIIEENMGLPTLSHDDTTFVKLLRRDQDNMTPRKFAEGIKATVDNSIQKWYFGLWFWEVDRSLTISMLKIEIEVWSLTMTLKS